MNWLGALGLGAALAARPGLGQVSHRRQGTTEYQEGGLQGGLDLVARSVGNLGGVRKQGNHDMAHGMLDQGGGMMALWELGPAGATAAAGDAGLGALAASRGRRLGSSRWALRQAAVGADQTARCP